VLLWKLERASSFGNLRAYVPLETRESIHSFVNPRESIPLETEESIHSFGDQRAYAPLETPESIPIPFPCLLTFKQALDQRAYTAFYQRACTAFYQRAYTAFYQRAYVYSFGNQRGYLRTGRVSVFAFTNSRADLA
jgi:hypothetical protein